MILDVEKEFGDQGESASAKDCVMLTPCASQLIASMVSPLLDYKCAVEVYSVT